MEHDSPQEAPQALSVLINYAPAKHLSQLAKIRSGSVHRVLKIDQRRARTTCESKGRSVGFVSSVRIVETRASAGPVGAPQVESPAHTRPSATLFPLRSRGKRGASRGVCRGQRHRVESPSAGRAPPAGRLPEDRPAGGRWRSWREGRCHDRRRAFRSCRPKGHGDAERRRSGRFMRCSGIRHRATATEPGSEEARVGVFLGHRWPGGPGVA